MDITHISATQLKNDTAVVLNTVFFNKTVITIEKYGKPIAQLIPVIVDAKKQSVEAAIDDTFGALSDFPQVSAMRAFRKRSLSL